MNKGELIGKLQMVYVGDKNALNELIGYYDGLKQGIEELQQENQQLKDRDLIIAAELTKLQDENIRLKKESQKQKEVIIKVMNLIKKYGKYDGEKCGKEKIKTINKHFYHEWEKIK